MPNLNGQVVLSALRSLRGPATSNEIVSRIADAVHVPPNDVKEIIQETLDGGVRNGFIQRFNRKYSVTSVVTDDAAMADEVNTECAEAEKDGEKKNNNRNSELEEEIKEKKGGKRAKRKYSVKGLPVEVVASLKKDNKESGEVECVAGNGGQEKKDNNQNDELEAESKRRKVDKCAFAAEGKEECVEAGAGNDGDEKKENNQAEEMKEVDKKVSRKKGIKNTGAAVRSD